jgi:hypothetical protein
MKIRISRNITKDENTDEKATVSVFSAVREMPTPILSLKRRRNSVEATHKVRLTITKLV